MLGTDSEELIFVEIGNFGKDVEKGIDIYLKERGRFTREFYGRVDVIAYNKQERIIALLSDRKHIEYLAFRTKEEATKKFKRKRKRAKENKKEFELSQEDYMLNLGNWIEPISRTKTKSKMNFIVLG